MSRIRHRPLPGDVLDQLRGVLGDRVSTAPALLEQHSRGESHHAAAAPEVVVFPETTAEVSAVVQLAAAHRMPLVPFGAGTSLEGHVCALSGGIAVDMRRMNQVIEIRVDDLDVTVQAGVTLKQLDHALRNTGLFFPIDPGADATLGGMAATRASGTTTVRYGTMRENVMALEVVLADGRAIWTAGRARKSAAGYDLTRLFVGSEGTLGIITHVTLRLYGRPEAIASAVCGFDSIEGAVRTVISTVAFGIPVARCEVLDQVMMQAVSRYSTIEYHARPTLFFEFHGTSLSAITGQAEMVQDIARENGGHGFEWASSPEDRHRLWHARHNAFYAALALRPGSHAWTTDVCVPLSQLTECILETIQDCSAAPFPAALVGHVGDGNFHMLFAVDRDNSSELAHAEILTERMIGRALACGGTSSGEHGIGYGKVKYMRPEHGAALDVMGTIKHALDPQGILNPGKMLDGRAPHPYSGEAGRSDRFSA